MCAGFQEMFHILENMLQVVTLLYNSAVSQFRGRCCIFYSFRCLIHFSISQAASHICNNSGISDVPLVIYCHVQRCIKILCKLQYGSLEVINVHKRPKTPSTLSQCDFFHVQLTVLFCFVLFLKSCDYSQTNST